MNGYNKVDKLIEEKSVNSCTVKFNEISTNKVSLNIRLNLVFDFFKINSLFLICCITTTRIILFILKYASILILLISLILLSLLVFSFFVLYFMIS